MEDLLEAYVRAYPKRSTPLPLVHHTRSCLAEPAMGLEEIDTDLISVLADDLVKDCVYYKGLGLAANQVGIPLKIFVIWSNQKYMPDVIINPTVKKTRRGSETRIEGCLSLPGNRIEVPRAREVRLAWRNIYGKYRDEWFKGVPAKIVQHETDHLEGVLIDSYREKD